MKNIFEDVLELEEHQLHPNFTMIGPLHLSRHSIDHKNPKKSLKESITSS